MNNQFWLTTMNKRLPIIYYQDRAIADCIKATLKMMPVEDDLMFKTLKATVRSLCRLLPFEYCKIDQIGWKMPLSERVMDTIQAIEDQIDEAFEPMRENLEFFPIVHYATNPNDALNGLIHRLKLEASRHLETAFQNGHWDGKSGPSCTEVLRMDPRLIKREKTR